MTSSVDKHPVKVNGSIDSAITGKYVLSSSSRNLSIMHVNNTGIDIIGSTSANSSVPDKMENLCVVYPSQSSGKPRNEGIKRSIVSLGSVDLSECTSTREGPNTAEEDLSGRLGAEAESRLDVDRTMSSVDNSDDEKTSDDE